MSFCAQCGTQLEDGAAFCGKCGARQGTGPVVRQTPGYQKPVNQAAAYRGNQTALSGFAGKKLHCPNCKSQNIAITTESSVNGGITHARGNTAVTRMSNTHRNYWVCHECGTKFRNIQNLEDEILMNRKGSKMSIVASIILGIISLFLIINTINNPLGGLFLLSFTVTAVVATVVFFCFIFVYNNRAEKMEREKAYLQANCFD